MPSLSPGGDTPSTFHQILPGAPVPGLQSITTLIFRWKRYIIYISKHQLSILRSPTELVQAIAFNEEELVAVIAEPNDNGRIALATEEQVWILKPVTSAWNRVTWAKDLLLVSGNEESKSRISTLSWTAEGELLVGSTHYILLFGTNPSSRIASPADESLPVPTAEQRKPIWSKAIASAAQFCRFSPSANLIATSASRDRLVKIWRRLSFEEGIFDYAYLPHEGLVTHLEWRSAEPAKLEIEEFSNDRRSIASYHGQDEPCEVLFTLATDAQLRIWRTNGYHDLEMLSLYTVIDLVSAIPHSPVLHTRAGTTPSRPARYTFTIPSFAYSAAAGVALKKHPQGKLRHSMEHVREVSSRAPDVIVAVDGQGRMSAWGVANVGHKRRPTSAGDTERSPFHVAHSDDMGLRIGEAGSMPATFETWFEGDTLNVIMHEFNVGVKWWQGNIEGFSSSAAISDERGRVIANLTGCNATLAGLRANANLSSLLAWTETGELTTYNIGQACNLQSSQTIRLDATVHDADSVQREKSLIALCKDSIALIRITDKTGTFNKSHPLPHGEELHMLRIDANSANADDAYILYNDQGIYCIADVNPTRSAWDSQEAIVSITNKTSTFDFRLNTSAKLGDVVRVNVLVHPRKAAWLRIVALTSDGIIIRRDVSILSLRSSDTAQPEEQSTLIPTQTAVEHLVSVPDCAAVLSSNGLTLLIADIKAGYLEHSRNLDQQATGLTFARTAYDDPVTIEHSMLALTYVDGVEILSRHKLLRSDSAQQWLLVKRVSIVGIGSTISAVDWLPQGRLAIASGSSILVADNVATIEDLDNNIKQSFELSSEQQKNVLQVNTAFGMPVVCWHSSFLRTLVAFGHFNAVVAILRRLQEQLRFYTVGDHLDALLGLDFNAILSSKISYNDDFAELNDKLAELDMPFTSDVEQEHIKLVVRTAEYVLRFQQSLDTNAVKYLFEWRLRVLLDSHRQDKSSKMPNGVSHHSEDRAPGTKAVPTMDWREISFAYHSTTQQPLLEALIQYYENKLDWQTVRALGIAMWLHTIKAAQSEGSAIASLEQIFDALGQNAYRASQPPNPAEASLFLLALRKKAVLLSLWRVAIGNPEQKSTQNFLKRNFDVEEHRVAARKNAYALMGKRRFQYAAAFFLLADDVMSAISVLAGQCEDVQLAVAVARAYCGEDSIITRKFIQDRVVQSAKQTRDRWMLHWALHVQSRYDEAAKALVSSFDMLVEDDTRKAPTSWRQDDPAALITYRELRDAARHATGVKPASFQVSSTDEYRALLRAARILRRQGFWLLALHMVSQWRFATVETTQQQSPDSTVGPLVSSQHDQTSANLLDSFGVGTYTDPTLSAATKPTVAESVSTADQDSQSRPVQATAAEDRATKAAELLAKMRAKNAQKSVVPTVDNSAEGEESNKEKPTQFMEPSADSLLDNFGF